MCVCLNRLCICVVFMLMNILMNFEFVMLKKGMFVLLVMVCVSRVLLVLGGLMSRMFLGMWVLRWL